MGAVDAAEFEALVRRELVLRDRRRQGRLFQPADYAEAGELCVQAIMTAAGYGEVADGGKTLRKTTRTRQRDIDRVFGE